MGRQPFDTVFIHHQVYKKQGELLYLPNNLTRPVARIRPLKHAKQSHNYGQPLTSMEIIWYNPVIEPNTYPPSYQQSVDNASRKVRQSSVLY